MEIENYRLRPITTFIFDVDGVLTDGTIFMDDAGQHIRGFDIKDGYALKRAIKEGYNVAIISGHNHPGVRARLEELGVEDIYLGIPDKVVAFNEYCQLMGVKSEEVLFMGDDLPDYELMKMAGLSVCPKDAATDIQDISDYVSRFEGGKRAVRDVIEATLRAQDRWHLPHTDEPV